MNGKELNVAFVGLSLEITGLVPTYESRDSPCDLIRQYEKAPKQALVGQKRTGTQLPDVCFANAESDDKLIAFVRRFGPVVARCVEDTRIAPRKESGEPCFPGRLVAQQDLQDLRSEQTLYRAALTLIMHLAQPHYDHSRAQQLIKIIAVSIRSWPRQWQREKELRGSEPLWKLRAESLKRIESLSLAHPDPILPHQVPGRIVICELVNSFRSVVFPNPLEMHSSIQYGIRPLLYSLLRRQFLFPRGFSVCSNLECRNFFNIERSGQQFCSPECSLRQRQRIYWQKRGRKLRKKRTAQRRKRGG